MAIKITDDCINCGACEAECPNNAIYGPDELWKYSEGTSLSGNVHLHNGQSVDADASNQPVSEEFFYIVTNNYNRDHNKLNTLFNLNFKTTQIASYIIFLLIFD